MAKLISEKLKEYSNNWTAIDAGASVNMDGWTISGDTNTSSHQANGFVWGIPENTSKTVTCLTANLRSLYRLFQFCAFGNTAGITDSSTKVELTDGTNALVLMDDNGNNPTGAYFTVIFEGNNMRVKVTKSGGSGTYLANDTITDITSWTSVKIRTTVSSSGSGGNSAYVKCGPILGYPTALGSKKTYISG